MDSRADELIKRHGRLKGDRGVWESHWQELAERIWPDRANFLSSGIIPEGEKKTERVFDTTAGMALSRFASAMEWMLTPRTAKWHRLRVPDEDLNRSPAIQQYLDEVTSILFRVRYSSRANFASQIQEGYMSLGAFGTGGVLVEDMLGVGIRYKSIDLANTYIAENKHGIIDTVFREFQFTARQAMQEFSADALPDKIKQSAERSPDDKFTFIHCVRPASESDEKRKVAGHQYESIYVCQEERCIVETGGYGRMPYAIGRYITTPNEVYGRSPGMFVLPTIKMVNEMQKTVLRAGHLTVNPPLLLQDDGALSAFDLRPGALNYGGVDDRGQPLVHPLQMGARLDIGLDMIQAQQRIINEAYLITLFQILAEEHPQMTATEVMQRAQEKAALLAPTMGRQQSEMIGPMIEREIEILARAGVLPPMPDELIEAGGEYEIEYVSPLNQLQRAEEGVAIMRTLEAIAPMAQIDPSVMMGFDLPRASRLLAEINGVPAKILRSEEDIAAMQEEQAQTMQAAQLLEAAPIAAQTAKTLAEARNLGSQGIPPVVGGGI